MRAAACSVAVYRYQRIRTAATCAAPRTSAVLRSRVPDGSVSAVAPGRWSGQMSSIRYSHWCASSCVTCSASSWLVVNASSASSTCWGQSREDAEIAPPGGYSRAYRTGSASSSRHGGIASARAASVPVTCRLRAVVSGRAGIGVELVLRTDARAGLSHFDHAQHGPARRPAPGASRRGMRAPLRPRL
jgi:hypothetical protein